MLESTNYGLNYGSILRRSKWTLPAVVEVEAWTDVDSIEQQSLTFGRQAVFAVGAATCKNFDLPQQAAACPPTF